MNAPVLRVSPWRPVEGEIEFVVGPALGDCMAPYLHDGDLSFFQLRAPIRNGDLVLVEGPAGHYASKVILQCGDRLLLCSENDPPNVYRPPLRILGPCIGTLHYPRPKPRTQEVQRMIDEEYRWGREIGYGSIRHLADVFGFTRSNH